MLSPQAKEVIRVLFPRVSVFRSKNLVHYL